MNALIPMVMLALCLGLNAETWSLTQATYTNVRIHEVTPATVTIFHASGISKLNLADLPEDLQIRLGYDPEKASEWLSDMRAERKQQARKFEQARKLELQNQTASTAPDPVSAKPQTPRHPGKEAPFRFQNEVDLRPLYREKGLISKDQGRRPSCSIFAVVSALEYEAARLNGTAKPLSEEFLIWAVRQIQPGIPLNTGYHFNEVISALQTFGVPTLEELPNTFGKKIERIQPSTEVIQAALERTSITPVWFRRNDPNLVERIVSCLNKGTPVIVGVRWPHWRTFRQNNTLRHQVPLENASHAVTLIGYRNNGGAAEGTTFIFRNSYGYDWGMAGCGFMASSYLEEHVLAALYLKLD